MRVVSTALFAVAAVAASATAASLDVEPIESTPTTTTAPADLATIAINPSLSNATSNATRGREIGIQGQRCTGMDNANWDNVKIACAWVHSNTRINQFFKMWDGAVVKLCDCDNNLGQYHPWGSRWSPSWNFDKNVFCQTRDHIHADTAMKEFKYHNC